MNTLISSHKGHFIGKAGKIERNPYEVWEDEKGKYIKMFDSSNREFYFDFNDFDNVMNKIENGIKKKVTWNLNRNHKVRERNVYYVSAHFGSTTRRIHQVVLGHYGHGCKELTVDHIDQNTLNNRRYNLKLATKSEQLKNTQKRARKQNTCKLPDEIKQSELPKYIYYMKQKNNEYFVIQCHPAQEHKKKQWITTKSCNVSIKNKLQQALEKLNELNLISKNK